MSRQRRALEFAGVVALAILLYALVSCPYPALAADWCWSESAGAEGYRFYWSNVPNTWTSCNHTDHDTSICVEGRCCPGDFDEGWNVDIVYYVVTAYNAAGESSTEHGPVEACP